MPPYIFLPNPNDSFQFSQYNQFSFLHFPDLPYSIYLLPECSTEFPILSTPYIIIIGQISENFANGKLHSSNDLLPLQGQTESPTSST